MHQPHLILMSGLAALALAATSALAASEERARQTATARLPSVQVEQVCQRERSIQSKFRGARTTAAAPRLGSCIEGKLNRMQPKPYYGGGTDERIPAYTGGGRVVPLAPSRRSKRKF